MNQIIELIKPLIKLAIGAGATYFGAFALLFGLMIFLERFDDTPCEVTVYEVVLDDLYPYAEPGTYEAGRRDEMYTWLIDRGFAEHLDVYYNALDNNDEIWDRIEQIENATTLSDSTKEGKVSQALRENIWAAEKAFRDSVENSGLEIDEMEWCVVRTREAAL